METVAPVTAPPDWSVRDNDHIVNTDIITTAVPNNDKLDQRLDVTNTVKLSVATLNYMAIQEELEGHNVRGKLLLIQALRWVKYQFNPIQCWKYKQFSFSI